MLLNKVNRSNRRNLFLLIFLVIIIFIAIGMSINMANKKVGHMFPLNIIGDLEKESSGQRCAKYVTETELQ